MGVTAYPHLFRPLHLGSSILPNRVVMGAMHTRLERLDRWLERLIAFYRARVRGEVGLILTAGVSPNAAGRMDPDAPVFEHREQVAEHRAVTDAVHADDGLICLQILHAGRYAKHPECVGPSIQRAPINSFTPRALSATEIERTIEDFARTAALAREAGYDGVEIMGAEGYLINQFTAPRTNDRCDAFGGSFDARVRLPLAILQAVRRRVGADFIVIYRISAVDLVENGMTGAETARLAQLLEANGASIINTGIGWHESRVPTIAYAVPRAAWTYAVANVKRAVGIPIIASNRINTPEVAEELLASGVADLVSMARPLLADPDFVKKARQGRAVEINVCIACNQACLDRIFSDHVASCLVNPRAAREVEFPDARTPVAKRVVVVGAGPAGLAFAIGAAERGHVVTLFEAGPAIGGQLNMACRIPGKAEFNELLRYFRHRLAALRVDVRLGHAVTAEEIAAAGFEVLAVATGVRPRVPPIPGVDGQNVLSYVDVLLHGREVGRRVAIIGAGGIGFDVAEFLLAGDSYGAPGIDAFAMEYGLDRSLVAAGGLIEPIAAPPRRDIFMLQRKSGKLGARLGLTTGWILKDKLRRRGVAMIGGVTYEVIDERGLQYTVDGVRRTLAVDTVIVCAGQESERDLADELRRRSLPVFLIGGAGAALELDAMRAIDQAARLAVAI